MFRRYINGNNTTKLVNKRKFLIKVTTNLIRVPKNLREASGENKVIPLTDWAFMLAGTTGKSFERCEVFSGCTIKAKFTLYDIRGSWILCWGWSDRTEAHRELLQREWWHLSTKKSKQSFAWAARTLLNALRNFVNLNGSNVLTLCKTLSLSCGLIPFL